MTVPRAILMMSVTTILGGGSEVVYTLAKSLHHKVENNLRSYEVVVACPADGPYFEKMQSLGITAYDVPLRSLSLRNITTILTICRQHGIGLIHTHGKGAGLFGRLIGLVLNIPVVHSFHGFHYSHFSMVTRWLYLLSERILALSTNAYSFVSSGERDSFKKALPNVTSAKFHVVYNGIDPDRLALQSVSRVDFGISEDDFVIITMARISRQKGLEYLIEALPEVQRESGLGKRIKLIIAGDDVANEAEYRGEVSYRQSIFELRRRLGLENSVIIRAKSPDVLNLLSVCDCFVSASLGEGFSLAVVEAMLLRKAVIATDVTGNNEAVIHGCSGILVPAQDSNSLASALLYLINDPEYRAHVAAGGYERARINYSHNAMIAKTFAIYDQLLSKDRG